MVRGTFVNDINRKEAMQINKQYLIDSKYEEFRTMLYYCTNIFHAWSFAIFFVHGVIVKLTSVKEKG